MFEELFSQPSTIERYRTAPFAEERLRYLQYRAEAGASRSTLRNVANHQLCLVRHLELSPSESVHVTQVEAAVRKRTSRVRPSHRKSALPARSTLFYSHAVHWLRFLGWLYEADVFRHPHVREVEAFTDWMREERGFSEVTIHGYCAAADEFLVWLASRDMPLASVRIADIDRAIEAKHARRRYSRATIKVYADRLRAFFRFAEARGWCMPGLATGILPVRSYPDETVPARLKREEIERLLATTEGDRPADKRDRAILMLLVAYGLRSGEVRGLQLHDIDWENETVRVRRPKPGRTHFYPLSRSVQAILRYILEVRPRRSERTLFFTSTPRRPLSGSGLGGMGNRLDRLGRHRGPHALRMSASCMPMKVRGLSRAPQSILHGDIREHLNALREVADFDLEGHDMQSINTSHGVKSMVRSERTVGSKALTGRPTAMRSLRQGLSRRQWPAESGRQVQDWRGFRSSAADTPASRRCRTMSPGDRRRLHRTSTRRTNCAGCSAQSMPVGGRPSSWMRAPSAHCSFFSMEPDYVAPRR